VELLVEHDAEVRDVFDLLRVVADRAACGETAAEDFGVPLHRLHGDQPALGTAGLIHESRVAAGQPRKRRLRGRDQLEQVAFDPLRLQQPGAADGRDPDSKPGRSGVRWERSYGRRGPIAMG